MLCFVLSVAEKIIQSCLELGQLLLHLRLFNQEQIFLLSNTILSLAFMMDAYILHTVSRSKRCSVETLTGFWRGKMHANHSLDTMVCNVSLSYTHPLYIPSLAPKHCHRYVESLTELIACLGTDMQLECVEGYKLKHPYILKSAVGSGVVEHD